MERETKKLNSLIEKKFRKFVKNKKRRKPEKKVQHLQELKLLDDESKKSVSSVTKSVVIEEISSNSSKKIRLRGRIICYMFK